MEINGIHLEKNELAHYSLELKEKITAILEQTLDEVLDKNNKAVRRKIKTGRLADGLQIIREGLSSDDTVIVDGTQDSRAAAFKTGHQTVFVPLGDEL